MNANTECCGPVALARTSAGALGDDDGAPEMPKARGSSSRGSRQPKPRLRGWFALILVGLTAAVGAGMVPRLHKRAAVVAETRELAVATVGVTTPTLSDSAAGLTLSGELKPAAEASIYARASGYVRRWYVDLGAQVEAGQLLAELDTPELDRELSQARAELNESEASRNLAETTAKRWTLMLTGKTVSAQEAEEKTGDLALKKAAVQAAAAKVQRLEELAGFAKITAPFRGTITARLLDVGQLVNAGAGQELFKLAQTDHLRVFVRVPQSYARAIAADQAAEITTPELPGRKFPAKIVRTAGAMDVGSRTLLTELEVDNSAGELFAGSYALARLPGAKTAQALTVPSNALLFRAEGTLAAIVGSDNHVRLRPVVLGRDFGPRVEIAEGLAKEDRVVVNPADSLVDGAEVRVAEAKVARP